MWFTEDALTPCALFGAAGLVTFLSGLSSSNRMRVVLGVLLMAVAGRAFAVDHLVITDREQIEARVQALCDDFRHKRAGTVDYFSPTSPLLKAAVIAAMALVTVEDQPRLTDFDIEITNNGTRATSHFRANATVSVKEFGNVGHQPSRFVLTWSREQNEWRIIKVRRLHPYRDDEMELLEKSAG